MTTEAVTKTLYKSQIMYDLIKYIFTFKMIIVSIKKVYEILNRMFTLGTVMYIVYTLLINLFF